MDSIGSLEALAHALPADGDDIGQLVSLTFPQLWNGRLLPNVGLGALFKFISWFLVRRKKPVENSSEVP